DFRPHGLSSILGDAGTVLMHAHNGCVDHLHRDVMSAGECAHHLGPDARSSPANEAIVTSGVRTEVVGQVAPRRAGSQDPEDAIEDTTVIHPWDTAWFVWQHRPDGSPLMVGEFVAHDSSPSVLGLNHDTAVALNMHCNRVLWSLCTR